MPRCVSLVQFWELVPTYLPPSSSSLPQKNSTGLLAMTGARRHAARELFATGGRRSRRGGDVRGDGVGHGAVGADHDQRERTVVPRKVW